jgi:surfactin synthase thioesterase subunit
VHRQGAGPALVCLPAFADSTASWRLLTDTLSDRFDVAVLELPGLNRAGEPPVDPDLASLADLIARALKHTWTSQLTIIGHSAGAALAVRAAHMLKGQCRAIVSIEGN